MRRHYVEFISPGTLFAETTTKAVDQWDPAEAVKLAEAIVERHGARPYGFRFKTCIVAGSIPDGEGGELRVEPKTVETSGMYYLGGRLRTIDEVKALSDPKEKTLLSNMLGRPLPIVVEVINVYKSTQPFEEGDVIVDARGQIVERGDDPKHVAFRAARQRA